MITNFNNKVRMVFGTGDIGFNAGTYMENGKDVGLIIFYNQEAREIGAVADIKAGTPVNFEDFPVIMEFHRIESIDTLIEQLVVARNEMEVKKSAIFKS